MEEWKDIYFIENGIEYDYRGLYQVSNLGNIKSLGNGNSNNSKERILKPLKNKCGYLFVILSKNGKQKHFKVHRLIAHMFIDGYFEGAYVDHINTIRDDNRAENLRWVTPKENCNNTLTKENLSEAHKGENNPMYGKHHTEETKNKISEAKKGKYCGENNHNYGKHHSEETKQKISEANKGSLIERWSKDGKLIDIKYQFEYVEMGFNAGNISSCCKGKRKSTGGYIFKYHEELE